MPSLILCTACGARTSAELAPNERDLVTVGMLERRCSRCSADTRWGLAEDYRRGERRQMERRRGIGRWTGAERRKGERRSGGDRRGSRAS
jgi:hypothetical protein